MKFSIALSSMALLGMAHAASHAHDEDCTHGMLYVAAEGSSSVRTYDLSSGSLQDLAVKDTIAVPGVGTELNLNTDSSNTVVNVIYRGLEDQLYQDGAVRWIDTGVHAHTEEDGHVHVDMETPSLIDNAAFECARAIHYVPHDSKIAIFCDGAITNTSLVNTTVWVVDETKFGSSSESAIIFETTLDSSHHGVAVPVDEGHIMYSLPLPERIAGDFSRATALPATFEVVDYQGNLLHAIDDTASKDTSCAGFHGSWAKENTFALACDDTHGGIVVVDYNAGDASYTSRALMYPDDFPGHRTGNFAEHHKAPLAVGTFSADKHHLISFDPTSDSTLSADNILALGDVRQCSYLFELSEGQLLMVLTPDGTFSVYEVSPTWKLLASKVMFPGMEDCNDVMMVAGYGQAFVLSNRDGSSKIHSIDLHHVTEGELESFETSLDYVPFSAVVAGVPEKAACKLSGDEEEEKEEDAASAGNAFSFIFAMMTLAFVSMLF